MAKPRGLETLSKEMHQRLGRDVATLLRTEFKRGLGLNKGLRFQTYPHSHQHHNKACLDRVTDHGSGSIISKTERSKLNNQLSVNTSVKTAVYTAAYGDYVRYDPTGGAFAITLPAASSMAGGEIELKNVSVSVLQLSLTPAGTDTIDLVSGVKAMTTANEHLRLKSDGISDWMIS